MATPKLTDAECQEALNAKAKYAKETDAAEALGITRGAFQARVRAGRSRGMEPQIGEGEASTEVENRQLRERLRVLEAQQRKQGRDELLAEFIKKQLYALHSAEPTPPGWTLKTPRPTKKGMRGITGIPSLLLSDFHWDEVVDPGQVEGCNEYNRAIAHRRLRRVIETSIDLLTNHLAHPSYPGIVVLLGGDMVSGDIHAELQQTNEASSVQTVLDLQGALVAALRKLADEFGCVYVVAVTGNHGRTTAKPHAKNRVYLSYDWLLYKELEFHLQGDDRFAWYIPDGADAYFALYNTRYRFTHGDGFTGGDGLIGPLGPVARGDHKKRTFSNQIGRPYDTLILGHFHTAITLPRFMANSSLVGYNEYAYRLSLPWEPPSQLLWLTHPVMGVTFPMRVFADEPEARPQAPAFAA